MKRLFRAISGLLIAAMIFTANITQVSAVSILNVDFQQMAFRNGTFISGNLSTVGSKYKFSNVFTGDGISVDAIVTIEAISNAGMTSIDDDTDNINGFDPKIYSNNSGGGYIIYKFDFVNNADNSEVVYLQNFMLSGIDIDGNGSSVREYQEILGYASYQKDSSSKLTISSSGTVLSGGTKFLGLSTSLDKVSFDNSASYIANYSAPVSSLTALLGVTGSINSSGARLFSLNIGAPAGEFSNAVKINNPNVPTITVSINDGDGILNASDNISAVPVSGSLTGVSDGSTVLLSFTDGTNTVNTTATAISGAYNTTVDLSTLNSGTITATANVTNTEGNPASPADDTTVKAETYTITYTLNNGIGSVPTDSNKYFADQTATVLFSPAPTRVGYTFQGWAVSSTASEATYMSDGTTTFTISSGNVTLNAIWAANSSTVTLDDNGGSGGSGSVTATYGQPMPTALKPVRTGYTFAGYFDQTTGGSPYYNADMSSAKNWDKTGADTLYAKWDASTCSVTFDANGGAFADSTTAKVIPQTYDQKYVLPSGVPSRNGYTFASWNTQADGNGETITDAADMLVTAPQSVVYALWTEASNVTLNYSSNNTSYGTVSVSTESLKPATGTATGSSAIANEGFHFVQWQDGNGTRVTTSETFVPEKVSGTYVTASYTAVFAPNTYSVTLNDNGGSGGSGSVTVTYGQSMPIALAPARTGYTFAGYSDQTTGGALYYNIDMSSVKNWDKTDASTLYAQWDANTCSVTFDANGGAFADSTTTQAISQTYDQKYVLPSGNPSRNGYTFASWNTQTDGSGTTITEATDMLVTTPESVVYALWTEAGNVTLNYSSNNTGYGTVSVSTESLNPIIGTATGSIAIANEGFHFVQWQDGNGTRVTTSEAFVPEKVSGSYVTASYTAVFAPNTYSVTLNDNGGSGGSGSVAVTYGQPMPTANKPVKDEYTFDGYYDALKNGNQYYDANMNSTSMWNKTDESAVLYARWKAHDVEGTVKDDANPANNVSGADIRIIKGNTQYGDTVTTDSNGDFTIHNIPAGEYNLIMTAGSKTEIIKIVVRGEEPVTRLGVIIFPLGNASSALKLEGAGTPPIVIDNLHPEAEDYYSNSGVNPAHFVKVEMTIAKTDQKTAQDNNDASALTAIAKINGEAGASGATIGLYLDMLVNRYQRTNELHSWDFVDNLTRTKGLIQVIIPIPADLQGKVSYVVYRYHANTVNTIKTAPNMDGEYLSLDTSNWTLTLYLRNFSIYAIGYFNQLPAGNQTAYNDTKYDITFDSDGGTPSSIREDIVYGGLLPKPADPKKDGYSFDGWYKADGTPWNFSTDRVYSDITLKAKWSKTATDANSNIPALDKVNHIAYMQGYPNENFGPGNNMSRAEATAMFARLLVEKMDVDEKYLCSFSDIDGTEWYANAVGYMEKYGIIKGYSDGTFKPQAPITRAEFAAIAARFDILDAGEPNRFSDIKENYWARDVISSSAAKGWVKGNPDGTFQPEKHITRAEVVTIVNRMLERVCDKNYESKNINTMKHYKDLTSDHWAYYDIIEASNGHKYNKESNSETWLSLIK